MIPRGQKSLSNIFTSVSTGFKGLAELKHVMGTIMSVDPHKFTATVRTTQGVFEGVKIPINCYTPGTGIFAMPSKNDLCLLTTSEQGQHFIVNFYSGYSGAEADSEARIEVDPQTIVIKSPKKLEFKVETETKSCILSISSDEDGEVYASTHINVITRDSNGKVSDVDSVSSIVQDSKTGNMELTTTAKASTGTITITSANKNINVVASKGDITVRADTGNILLASSNAGTAATSPILTAKALQNILTTSAVAIGDGGATLKTNVAASLGLLTSRINIKAQ